MLSTVARRGEGEHDGGRWELLSARVIVGGDRCMGAWDAATDVWARGAGHPAWVERERSGG
jgi:hypothetical protein